MTTETMTLTRALAETKSIQDRLGRLLDQSYFVTIAQGQGSNKKIAMTSMLDKTVEAAERQIQANFQSATDLISRYQLIKRALILANAATEITIAGKRMTIAEAIERKKSIEMEKSLLLVLRQQYKGGVSTVEQLNNRLNDTIEKGITQLYGSDRTKITEEQLQVVSQAKKQDFEPFLVDPLSISKKIEELTESIENFLTEINFSLSEVNAKTVVEI